MSSTAKLRIEILPAQRFVDRSDEQDPKYDAEAVGVGPETDFVGRSNELAMGRTVSSPGVERTYLDYVVGSSSGIVQTIRRLLKGNSGVKYLAFSLRPEIIWDENLAARILRELSHFEAHCSNWLVLSAHGRNLSEDEFVSAHFNYEPDLIPTRGRKPVVLTSGLLYVVNIEKFGKYFSALSWSDEVEETINVAIAMGYLDGTASYFTDRLFPCLLGRRNLSLSSSAIWTERVTYLIHYGDSPGAENRREFKIRLLNALLPNEDVPSRLKLTFVIRTIFNRQHLLQRCLISVEYIRRSLGVPVEIVIASDIGAMKSGQSVSALRESFPHLEFVSADGNLELGVSRVRNLKAGIKASTGDWVCIIDDDDYYLTHACSVLEKLLEPGFSGLLLLNAQIVNERWTKTTWKYQKEITSYGTVYDSKEWAKIYTGVNALPLSSVVHPGSYVRRIISEYEFRYDLSEDFIFHLLVFSHPSRPAVAVSLGVSVHQSHRSLSDNVSTNVDRAGWCLDTGNGLYDLLFGQDRQFEDLSEVGRHFNALNEQKDARNDREELIAAALESARQKIVKLKQASIRIGQLEQERDAALEVARKCELSLEAMAKVSALEQERDVASPLRSFLERKFRKTEGQS